MQRLWGGRFEKTPDPTVVGFGASIDTDRRLFREDIDGSIAHATMLGAQRIIPKGDVAAIVEGLNRIRSEIENGTFPFRDELEDIHLNIEHRLKELIGEPAGRLHTARSRNDQVALDNKLWLFRNITITIDLVLGLMAALLEQASKHIDVVLPGYTHLQRAQPVHFAHHQLAYFEMLRRDLGRLEDCRKRLDEMPLGSGALAGSPYPLNREMVAEALGFGQVTRNSLDAVSDRDYFVEFLSAAALMMAHLSRYSEEVVIWTSSEFGFLALDSAYATGSSMMPQKKNPDVAELVRGKTGRVYGHLMAMLTILKGLPLSYNRDLQEDKPAVFDAADTVNDSLSVFTGMVVSLQVRADRMAEAANDPALLATDIADYLTKQGLPFRQAHEVVGRLVLRAETERRSLVSFSLEELKQESDLFETDLLGTTTRTSIDSRDVPGGTAKAQVEGALAAARDWLNTYRTKHRVEFGAGKGPKKKRASKRSPEAPK